MKVAFFCQGGAGDADLWRVFDERQRARIESNHEVVAEVITARNFDAMRPALHDVDVIFSTWGMWELAQGQLDAMPKLQAVFYAAGAVKHFAGPFLERGIIVTSSWRANAVPVAEFTLAQILLANKGYFANREEYRTREDYEAFRGPGNYGATVSVLGAGQIGRKLMDLLKAFEIRVLCFDPYLTHKAAEALGVQKVELAEAMTRGDVVSNHLADVPDTVGLIDRALLSSLSANATFINTGRGKTVVTEDMVEVFSRRSDLTALLDVTDPEPLPLAHPLRKLANVYLTSHIAGSIGGEVTRMGQLAVDEFERWLRGEKLQHSVTLQMLATMA